MRTPGGLRFGGRGGFGSYKHYEQTKIGGKYGMNKLEIVLDSREVAAMVEKEHSKLLRDIRTYVEQMDEVNKKAFEEGKGAEAKIGLGDFFKESSYLDANNQSRPC